MDWYLGVLRKYGDFTGRAPRAEYWTFVLIHVLIVVAVAVVGGVVITVGGDAGDAIGWLVSALLMVYSLALVIPVVAVTARRLHDIGRSGWWQLITFIPALGGIVLLILAAQDSQPGDNRWGPNPKGIQTPVYQTPTVAPTEAQSPSSPAPERAEAGPGANPG